MGLHLPNPNPFIPEDLSLRELPADPPSLPMHLPGVSPVTNIFHRQDNIFKQPKADIRFQIFSPFIMQDIATYVKVDLWCGAVQEALQDYAYDAEVAGVGYSLHMGS